MDCKKKKAFTVIEAVMVIVIIAILAVGGAYLMSYFVQNGVYLPRQLNMEMLASDALDIMVEGDPTAKGLRFSRRMTNIANNQVTFINQNGQSIRYRLVANILYRSISGGPDSRIPYYVPTSGVSMTGKSGILFNYYDVNNNTTGNAGNVRRVAITLIAQTGTGAYTQWEGQSEQSTSITVKRLQ